MQAWCEVGKNGRGIDHGEHVGIIRYCEGCGIVGWRGSKCNCTPEELNGEA
tara:strand:+ start:4270 stop:4422 length:153 start_codon:yes stop_codon:yes gene_type:complete